MASPRPLVAGNWKMNGLKASAAELQALIQGLKDQPAPAVDVMICPPATLLLAFSALVEGSPVTLGAQDCHTAVSGAHTGDLSPEMLVDAGASAIIIGHSERRADHGEKDADVRVKCEACWRAGAVAIVCIGETEGQRKLGLTLDVVKRQLKNSLPDGVSAENTVIAYEPVWAIGTGLTPTVDDVAEVHGVIRAELEQRFGTDTGSQIRLQYGGSVKPGNAKELMSVANVNGALVGGASLKAEDFLGIIAAYR